MVAATPSEPLAFVLATAHDVPALRQLRIDVARALTAQWGQGPWSAEPSERGVLGGLRHAQVWLARETSGTIAATYRLLQKKPWAIDVTCFTPCRRALYLTDMAVHPAQQRRGLGRRCLDHATHIARAWPAQAIRLDAYDAGAGAGGFYARCGFASRGRVVYRGTPLLYFERLVEDAPTA